jgi:hypothetical protein
VAPSALNPTILHLLADPSQHHSGTDSFMSNARIGMSSLTDPQPQ